VNMPRMNGLDMIAELQRTGVKILILMLTTEGQPSLIKRAREAGASGQRLAQSSASAGASPSGPDSSSVSARTSVPRR